jgi:hypothetical protein
MSVRKGDRGETKLEVLDRCRLLSTYTVQACRNEKIFPKSSRWIMAKPIVDECLSAITCIRRANAADLFEQMEYRRNQQSEAFCHLEALLTLINLAYDSFSIEGGKIETWTGHVIHTENTLRAWMKSDKQRLKEKNTLG